MSDAADENFFAAGEAPSDDDPYILAQRKAARTRALVIALAVLAAVGFFLFRMGQKQAAVEAMVAQTELLMATGSFEDLREASTLASSAASADDLAPAAYYVQGLKADLALWWLYTGSQSLTSKAQQMLEVAELRGPDEQVVVDAKAFVAALTGDPAEALAALDGAAKGTSSWHSVARAQAQIRSGDVAGARATLGGCESGLCRTWSARLALDLGDWEAAKAAADAVVAGRAGHDFGRTVQILATARSLDPEARIERLQAYMEETDLPALLLGRVVVALSRALRRAEGPKRADELLERALESSPDATELAREVSRTKRFQGYFGAAWTRSDKALRNRPADGGLLTELSAALFFNDAAEVLEDRLDPAKKRGGGDGVRRGEAIAALIRGLNDQAIEGLKATEHLGEPGDTDLYLAEAFFQAERYAEAAKAAQRATAALSATFGPASREAAIGKMYEGVAVGLGGDADGAEEILEAAYAKDVRTVWGAWLYGRYHKANGKLKDAKDAFLLACHNGQDFAKACLALADTYEEMQMDGVMRRTQTEARKSYLRTSPRGWNAQRVKSALGK